MRLSATSEVVSSGEHSTGSSFQGLMHLVGILRPQCVMLENVPSLKDKPKDPKALSNFEAVRKAFHDESYVFASKVFCARDVGMPVRRGRLYMVVAHAQLRRRR